MPVSDAPVSTLSGEHEDRPAIRLDGVWKIFGQRAAEALIATRDHGLSKTEVLERYERLFKSARASLEPLSDE